MFMCIITFLFYHVLARLSVDSHIFTVNNRGGKYNLQTFQEQEFSQYDSHWILWCAGVPFGMVWLKSRTIIYVQTRQWCHIDDVKVSYVIHLDSLYLASSCMPDTHQNAQPFDVCVLVNKITREVMSCGFTCVA